MANIYDVAKYILHKKGCVSTWKLEKLCYYAQAWALAWTERPLFEENFQAWVNGPVCPELFQLHKGKFMIAESDLNIGNIAGLSNDEQETIDIVLEHYGNLDAYQLRELSHSEDPWKRARGKTKDNCASNAIISKESMGEYYGSL